MSGTQPTQKATLLIFLLTRSYEESVSDIYVKDPLLSDHFAVHPSLPTTKAPLPQNIITFHPYKKINIDEFKVDLLN